MPPKLDRLEDPFYARLLAFYKEKNPSKLREVPVMLERYRGREEELFAVLVVKYGDTEAEKGNEVTQHMLKERDKKEADAKKLEEQKASMELERRRHALFAEAERHRLERAWRVGQSRAVAVYRLVTAGTLEEKILERAERKLYLDRLVIEQARHFLDTS